MTKRPLDGIRILEFAGIGPAPFAGMLLSDLGADVVRIDRPGTAPLGVGKVTGRGRRSVALDLKTEKGRDTALSLIENADALFEGFRPGVMERIGLGPDICQKVNPRLVYGRMTGWGQTGPLSHSAGHDLNYIAISGALGSMGQAHEKPPVPLNLVGDYGGGAMFLVVGLIAGLLEARTTGKGRTVDAAMSDGSALLMAMFHDLVSIGAWTNERGQNFLDGAAPFYDAYECADGNYVTIGAIEPQFYALLLDKMGLTDDPDFRDQNDRDAWPVMKLRLAETLRRKTRAEWVELLEGTDVCFAPVLSMTEAVSHPHNAARSTFIDYDGVIQPAAAPRFDDTPTHPVRPAPSPGEHTDEVLSEWGVMQPAQRFGTRV